MSKKTYFKIRNLSEGPAVSGVSDLCDLVEGCINYNAQCATCYMSSDLAIQLAAELIAEGFNIISVEEAAKVSLLLGE